MEPHYKKLVKEISDIHQIDSPQELLRWYSQQVINTRHKKEKQKLNAEINDRVETKTIEDFFQQEPIIQEGLTLKGFSEYLTSLKKVHKEYYNEIEKNLI